PLHTLRSAALPGPSGSFSWQYEGTEVTKIATHRAGKRISPLWNGTGLETYQARDLTFAVTPFIVKQSLPWHIENSFCKRCPKETARYGWPRVGSHALS